MNDRFNLQYAEETIPVLSRRIGSWQISVKRLGFNASELARLYDRAARRWDRTLDRLGYPVAYERLLRTALSEEPPGERHPRVLDSGAGTGALSIALAGVLPGGFELDAIDVSPYMLERAGENFRDAGLDATVRLGDVRCLPYGDGVFDLVITGHVLEHLGRPGMAVREMVRVLKPGGVLIACLTRRSVPGMLVHLKWRTHLVTPGRIRTWLAGCALEDVRCLPLDDHALHRRLSLACVGRKPRDADVSGGAGHAAGT